jgi:hypothetical protein
MKYYVTEYIKDDPILNKPVREFDEMDLAVSFAHRTWNKKRNRPENFNVKVVSSRGIIATTVAG